jgi:hypothetical protein
MGKSWLDLTNEGLRAQTTAFLATITPSPGTYGLATSDVTYLSGLVTSYSDALAITDEPSTRTTVTIEARNMAKRSLIAGMRLLYKKVLAANLTPDKIAALHLPQRDLEPTEIGIPGKAAVAVKERDENLVTVQITDPSDPNRRGKPPGVSGIAIFSYVGEIAPTTAEGWLFQGNTTRMKARIAFPASVAPGSKVWLTACFFNPRGMTGQAATPVSTYLPGGAAMAPGA